ncbi:hypothetical protein [Marinomonas primoryensis]|uniref:hypothetical protein n=1 Tax=Marinomonas primoryensis TaxID=178399 RepID=UPI001EF8AFEC|nr:hypothetical protein [Marinomonas primoryensis]
MSKWLVWTLLELSTFLLLANFTFLWLSHSLRKKNQEDKADSQQQEGSAEGVGIDSDPKSYKGLAHYLDLQINFAAASIIPGKVNQHEINRLKIWGLYLRQKGQFYLTKLVTIQNQF